MLAEAGVVRGLELHVPAGQRRGEVGVELGAVLHQADHVLVGLDTVVVLLGRHGQRQVLVGGVTLGAAAGIGGRHVGVARHGQLVDELAHALLQVPRTGLGDLDAGHGTFGEQGRGERAVAAANRVGDVHEGDQRVAGAELDDVHRGQQQRGARLRQDAALLQRDRIELGAVSNGHAGRSEVARAGVVDDDSRDRSVGVDVGVPACLDALRGVGQVEVHHRVVVAAAAVGDLDRVDAAGRDRRGRRALADVGQGDVERLVSAAGRVHREPGDRTVERDGGRCPGACAQAVDLHGRDARVPTARFGDLDARDAVRVGRVNLRHSRGARAAAAGDLHGGLGQGQGTQGPVGPRTEVVRDLRLVRLDGGRRPGDRRDRRRRRRCRCRGGRQPRDEHARDQNDRR